MILRRIVGFEKACCLFIFMDKYHLLLMWKLELFKTVHLSGNSRNLRGHVDVISILIRIARIQFVAVQFLTFSPRNMVSRIKES